MAVLNCVKPGAKTGQVILLVDLTTSGNSDETIGILERLGYKPEIRHLNYKSGVHVVAVVKDEQHDNLLNDDYLIDSSPVQKEHYR